MLTANINNKKYEIEFVDESNNIGFINDIDFNLDVVQNQNSFHILKDNYSYNVNILSVNPEEKVVSLEINKKILDVKITDEIDRLLNSMGINERKTNKNTDLKAPMPGLVSKVFVSKGDEIKKGDNLLVLEAMKMENNLKAENNAIIKDIIVKQGNSVEKNEVLITFE